MTREEAIVRLKGLYGNGYPLQEEALNMAIKALEREPCEVVLDKIRDEIKALPRELPTDARNMVRRTRVLDIIDKYTEGVRDKE